MLLHGLAVLLSLSVAHAACATPPKADGPLYLRGEMNDWAAQEDLSFIWSCDAYYLNLDHHGRQRFRIAAEQWEDAEQALGSSDGRLLHGGQTRTLQSGEADRNRQQLSFEFNGKHTLRLAFVHGQAQLRITRQTFRDPRFAPISEPIARSVRFDSRDLAHKAPFGPQPQGVPIQFSLRALVGISRATLVVERREIIGDQTIDRYLPQTRIALSPKRQGRHEIWQADYAFPATAPYGYYFELEIGGHTYVYHNNRDALPWTREQGGNGLGLIARAPSRQQAIRRFRHSSHAPNLVVPQWARDAVYYYIFPERFRNGDRSNDPQPGIHTYHGKPIEFHANWNERPYTPNSGDGSDSVYTNDYYGGDLAGIIGKLDYLKDLGVNTIYMTPIFHAASNHKYDTADYHRIDPHFGSNTDFERLCQEAAKRGLRVLPDASLNHTGTESVYFDRFGNLGGQGAFSGGKINPSSPYASWYRFDPSQSEPDKQYQGWYNLPDLPELDKSSPAWRDFAFGGRHGVMQTWLDRGAAGWRMDVTPFVPDDFWRAWRSAVKAHRPDAITVAETWFDASKFLLGDMFDSSMNYIFRDSVLAYAKGGDARVLARNLEYLRELYPAPTLFAAMNLISSHDTPRALHELKDDKTALRLAAFWQASYPGAPAIYYGDEVGVSGGADPDNRRTYPWADQGGKPDDRLLADYQRLFKLRHSLPILRHGSLSAPLHVDRHSLILARELDGQIALSASNNHRQPHTVSLPAPYAKQSWRDALSGRIYTPRHGRLTLPARSGLVLLAA